MTAGIMVCCMPTAKIVWIHIKGPVGSFIWSSARCFPQLTSRVTASKHKRMESTSNLRPDLNFASYQAQVVPRDESLPPFFDSRNDSSDWPRDHERSYPLDNIRKTTDIEIA